MNFTFWDRHKIACLIAALTLIAFITTINIMSEYEGKALEKATDKITAEEAEAVLKYYDLYEEHLPPIYNILDSTTTWLWIITLFATLYAAWTALDIPDRYRKQEKRTNISETEKSANNSELPNTSTSA